MSLSTVEFLRHILQEADYLLAHSAFIDEQQFLQNETLQRAFARSLEIIGEATKNLPDEFRQQHSEIEWRAMAGMRDRLIHDYFGSDYELVWNVVETKIPLLRQNVARMIDEEF